MSSDTTAPVETLAEQEQRVPGAMRHAHFLLQSKGGIGKSYVARLLSEFWDAEPWDLDNRANTLSNVSGPRTSKVQGQAEIDHSALDEMCDRILRSSTTHHVIDTGSWQWPRMREYMDNRMSTLFGDNGVQLWLHPVICGGQLQENTMAYCDQLVQAWHSKTKIVLWENLYFGEIINVEGVACDLAETKIYKDEWKDRTEGIITLPNPQLAFRSALQDLESRHMTFAEAIADPTQFIMHRQRLKNIWDDISARMSAVLSM